VERGIAAFHNPGGTLFLPIGVPHAGDPTLNVPTYAPGQDTPNVSLAPLDSVSLFLSPNPWQR